MTVSEFLPDYCSAIEILLIHRKGYHTYGPICAGIEFLGKCLDNSPKFTMGNIKGKNSFKKAIEDLMPDYKDMNDKYNFYGNLRNQMLHSFLPQNRIWLVETYSMSKNDKHLCERKIKGVVGLVLVANYFFDHFRLACKDVIVRISDGRIDTPKTKNDFISIIE